MILHQHTQARATNQNGADANVASLNLAHQCGQTMDSAVESDLE